MTGPSEKEIKNPIDASKKRAEKAQELVDLAEKHEPEIQGFIENIDKEFSCKSTCNKKKKERIIAKATRPAILETKEWFDVEHIRDALRFRTAVENLEDLPKIVTRLKEAGIEIVKAETAKMLKPRAWGWRAIMFDLRLKDGLLVEYYLTVREVMDANENVHHKLYEDWRERDIAKLAKEELVEYQEALDKSNDAFDSAWSVYYDRAKHDKEKLQDTVSELNKLIGI